MTTDQPERSARSAGGGELGSTRQECHEYRSMPRRFEPRTARTCTEEIRSSGRRRAPSNGLPEEVTTTQRRPAQVVLSAQRRQNGDWLRSEAEVPVPLLGAGLRPARPGNTAPNRGLARSEAEVPVPLLGAGLRPPDQHQEKQRCTALLDGFASPLDCSAKRPEYDSQKETKGTKARMRSETEKRQPKSHYTSTDLVERVEAIRQDV